jgi:hypothetical protein
LLQGSLLDRVCWNYYKDSNSFQKSNYNSISLLKDKE